MRGWLLFLICVSQKCGHSLAVGRQIPRREVPEVISGIAAQTRGFPATKDSPVAV